MEDERWWETVLWGEWKKRWVLMGKDGQRDRRTKGNGTGGGRCWEMGGGLVVEGGGEEEEKGTSP